MKCAEIIGHFLELKMLFRLTLMQELYTIFLFMLFVEC